MATGTSDRPPDRWAGGDAYEHYVGRWSAEVACVFVDRLQCARGLKWLDVGCGTGALTRAILSSEPSAPGTVCGVDPSRGFVDYARALTTDLRARFEIGEAENIPRDDSGFDVVVSGLVLNFLRDGVAAMREMMRVCRSGGLVAGYVWDYTGEMQMLHHFWSAVFEVVPDARDLDEVKRFAACRPDVLSHLFSRAGLEKVEVFAVEVPTPFRDFEDLWSPFLAGQGAAPGFVMSLAESTRVAIGESLRSRLPICADGSIDLVARAWAVRGKVKLDPAQATS